MRQHYLIEDKLPPKLPVSFSAEVRKEINDIYAYNQNNIDGIYQWNEYIDGLKSYISNPVIAWDYNHRYAHFPNGAIHLMDLGYDVSFIVSTNRTTNKNYVYVFMLNLKPEEFGLKVPPKRNSQSQVNNQPTNNIAQNISVDSNGNYVSANGWGADYVSETTSNNRIKLIRLTEQDLHWIVGESVNKVLRRLA